MPLVVVWAFPPSPASTLSGNTGVKAPCLSALGLDPPGQVLTKCEVGAQNCAWRNQTASWRKSCMCPPATWFIVIPVDSASLSVPFCLPKARWETRATALQTPSNRATAGLCRSASWLSPFSVVLFLLSVINRTAFSPGFSVSNADGARGYCTEGAASVSLQIRSLICSRKGGAARKPGVRPWLQGALPPSLPCPLGLGRSFLASPGSHGQLLTLQSAAQGVAFSKVPALTTPLHYFFSFLLDPRASLWSTDCLL